MGPRRPCSVDVSNVSAGLVPRPTTWVPRRRQWGKAAFNFKTHDDEHRAQAELGPTPTGPDERCELGEGHGHVHQHPAPSRGWQERFGWEGGLVLPPGLA
jgi:hypothetical protein